MVGIFVGFEIDPNGAVDKPTTGEICEECNEHLNKDSSHQNRHPRSAPKKTRWGQHKSKLLTSTSTTPSPVVRTCNHPYCFIVIAVRSRVYSMLKCVVQCFTMMLFIICCAFQLIVSGLTLLLQGIGNCVNIFINGCADFIDDCVGAFNNRQPSIFNIILVEEDGLMTPSEFPRTLWVAICRISVVFRGRRSQTGTPDADSYDERDAEDQIGEPGEEDAILSSCLSFFSEGRNMDNSKLVQVPMTPACPRTIWAPGSTRA